MVARVRAAGKRGQRPAQGRAGGGSGRGFRALRPRDDPQPDDLQHAAGEHDRLQTTCLAGLCLDTGGAVFQTKEQVDWGMWVPQGLPRTLIPPGGHATLALRAATLLTGVEAALTYSVSPEGAGEGAQAFLRIVHNGVNKPLG